MTTFGLNVVAAIRMYHVYKESWEPSVGDIVTFGRHISELPLRCHLLPVRGRTASSMHAVILSQCDDWRYEKLFLLVQAKGGAWFVNLLFAAFGISLLFSSHAYIPSFY